jgi:outer membrane protein assembly factor BamB
MSTPTFHDGLVYVLDPDGELACLAASDGTKQWQRSFVDDFGGRLMSGRGYGESPLIDGDRLLCTPGGTDAMIVALDRHTGETIWMSPFPEMSGKGREGAAFSSLNITEAGGVRQIVQLTGRGLVGIDAADGRFLWSYDDISNQTANIPTPVVQGDLVFAANGYHAGSVLLKIESDSGLTGVTATEVYRLRGNRFQNHHGGFILIDGHVFGGHGSNNGLPTCLDLATGKIRWKRRGPGTGSASVVAANGHLVFRYQDGVLCLIEATPEEFRLRGTFQTPSSGGDSWSHPVISNGTLFLREKDHLWAYDIRRSAESASPSAGDGLPAVALSLKDASVRLLSADRESEWPGRLHQFAFEAADNDALPLVSLNASHVTERGELKPSVLKELQEIGRPFVLSLAGTAISTPAARQLAQLKKLAGLDASVCPRMTDESFAALAGAPRLALLIAAGTGISRDGLSALADLPKLVSLDLETCDGVTDSSCRVLANMSGLRGLSLRKTGFEKARVGDVGLEQLTSLARLEVLDLEGNAVTDDGLKPLARLKELRELNLSILPLTDAGLAHLPHVPKLRSLSVRYSEGFAGVIVTDAGVRSLAGLSQLTSLNLTGAKRITDACVADIAQLKQLTTLNLSAAGLTADGIQQIQSSLPGCRVLSSLEASD